MSTAGLACGQSDKSGAKEFEVQDRDWWGVSQMRVFIYVILKTNLVTSSNHLGSVIFLTDVAVKKNNFIVLSSSSNNLDLCILEPLYIPRIRPNQNGNTSASHR